VCLARATACLALTPQTAHPAKSASSLQETFAFHATFQIAKPARIQVPAQLVCLDIMYLLGLVFNALPTAKIVAILQPARHARKATTSIRIILVLLVV